MDSTKERAGELARSSSEPRWVISPANMTESSVVQSTREAQSAMQTHYPGCNRVETKPHGDSVRVSD